MFKKKLFFIIGITLIIASACNSGEQSTVIADSTQSLSATDSMPVLHSPVIDSSAIIKTPSTNDNNVIVPDTTSHNGN
ncbi:MAG TPA: hypothetical protein VF610_05915 [Segetibacter sp.]|jgi:hypothetical protein